MDTTSAYVVASLWTGLARVASLISIRYALTNHLTSRARCTILVAAVIGSAVVPTVMPQTWSRPRIPRISQPKAAESRGVTPRIPEASGD